MFSQDRILLKLVPLLTYHVFLGAARVTRPALFGRCAAVAHTYVERLKALSTVQKVLGHSSLARPILFPLRVGQKSVSFACWAGEAVRRDPSHTATR